MAGEYQKQLELDAAASAASQEAHQLKMAFIATRKADPATRAAAREARDRAVIRALTATRDAAAFRAAQAAKIAKFAEEALQEVLARQAKERAGAESFGGGIDLFHFSAVATAGCRVVARSSFPRKSACLRAKASFKGPED